MPVYRYELMDTGYSSDRYGNCEVCHEPVRVVYHQIGRKATKFGGLIEDSSLFGHEICLINARKISTEEED